jgi:hypothetical protein
VSKLRQEGRHGSRALLNSARRRASRMSSLENEDGIMILRYFLRQSAASYRHRRSDIFFKAPISIAIFSAVLAC